MLWKPNSVDWVHELGCPNNVLRRKEKINFRPFIYSHSSTNAADLVKNGLVDVEIIGMTELLLLLLLYYIHLTASFPGQPG